MSRSLNKSLLIGHLGNDPEIRTTPSGAKVAQFSVATSRRWTDDGGNAREKTQWHRIVAWDRLADTADKYLKKGDRIHVEGEIEYRSYEPRDGSGTRYITEIRARDFIMLGGSQSSDEQKVPPLRRGAPHNAKPATPAVSESIPARTPARGRARAGTAASAERGDYDARKYINDDSLPF